jgi:hypothetical protein
VEKEEKDQTGVRETSTPVNMPALSRELTYAEGTASSEKGSQDGTTAPMNCLFCPCSGPECRTQLHVKCVEGVWEVCAWVGGLVKHYKTISVQDKGGGSVEGVDYINESLVLLEGLLGDFGGNPNELLLSTLVKYFAQAPHEVRALPAVFVGYNPQSGGLILERHADWVAFRQEVVKARDLARSQEEGTQPLPFWFKAHVEAWLERRLGGQHKAV